MVEKNKIFANLKEGLLIENQSWNLKWGTPLTELIPFCETSSVNSNNLPWLNFGPLTILDGIELKLVTPFDTMKSNNNESALNHVGQNLNLEDVDRLVDELTKRLGDPDTSNDTYGKFREWIQDELYIRIMPRMAHGGDWSSIIIGKETTYNKT